MTLALWFWTLFLLVALYLIIRAVFWLVKTWRSIDIDAAFGGRNDSYDGAFVDDME